MMRRWNADKSSMCGGRLVVYGREFARLQDGVVVDRRLATARRRGGEPLDSVLNQSEMDEFYRLSPGFFVMFNPDIDSTPPAAAFHKNSYLNDWMAATRLQSARVDCTVHYYYNTSNQTYNNLNPNNVNRITTQLSIFYYYRIYNWARKAL